MENNIVYFSVTLEASIILACLIFISILGVTKILPTNISRYGMLLLFTIAFLAFFYLIVNLGWAAGVNALIIPFVLGTVTLGWLFYLFNTAWVGYKLEVDRWIFVVPTLVLLVSGVTEVVHLVTPENPDVQSFRLLWTTQVLTYGFPLFNGFIIVLNAYKIVRAEKVNRNYFSSPEMIKNLRWSWVSLGGYTAFFLGIVLSGIVGDLASEFIFNFSILFLVLYLGYFEIQTIAQYLKVRGTTKIEPLKTVITGVENERFSELFDQVDALINEQKLFLQQDLSVSELSRLLQVNSKYLSQAINVKSGTNFNRYVNQKRVEYAVILLEDPEFEKFTMEGIGAESGFRSKSSFNTAFKEIMGCTPTSFKKGKT